MGEKIVSEGIKVDLHIHSAASRGKDCALVEDGTKENIQVLLDKLRENHVDMISITDHDQFDYDLYCAIKEKEGTDLKKILPGVEFSVGVESSETIDDKPKLKQVHVIAIFDDSNQKCLEDLSKRLRNEKYDAPEDVEPKTMFTEKTFREILQKSNMNVCLIAHQKGSPTSRSQKSPDAMALGEDKFQELLNYEYFEAYEFKTENTRIFHSLFKEKQNADWEKIRFITGSDCHVWSLYPQHDEKDASKMTYIYLKCLPTFRGLAMALTDDTRIQRNKQFFADNPNYLPTIDFTSNGISHSVPMSKGINAIIGDNSRGKSMFLYALTNYKETKDSPSKKNSKKAKNYGEYLDKHKIKIVPGIEHQNFIFDYQGRIRENFESGNPFESLRKEQKPNDTDSTIVKNAVIQAFNDFYKCLENKFELDNKIEELRSYSFKLDVIEAVGHFLTVALISDNKKNKTDDVDDIVNKTAVAKESLNAILKKGLDKEEKEYVEKIVQWLSKLNTKYVAKKERMEQENKIIDSINIGVKNFQNEQQTIQTNEQSNWTDYVNSTESFCELIASIFLHKKDVRPFEFEMKPIDPHYQSKTYGKYSIVSRFDSNRDVYDSNYCKDVLRSFCKVSKDFESMLDIPNLTEKELLEIIKDKNESLNKTPLQILKDKVSLVLSNDFKLSMAIIENGKGLTSNYSAGFNAAKYLYVLSQSETGAIYIIDQPEDDISQRAIKETVKDLKRMSEYGQVILVTHNPQFVVNLDVDNVLYFHNDENGELNIESGALEYEENEFDVLKVISDSLEGGINSLKKRWKRYEKNIEDDI